MRNIVLCEEEPRELPAEMNFDDGYDHLTEQQLASMKKMLARRVVLYERQIPENCADVASYHRRARRTS